MMLINAEENMHISVEATGVTESPIPGSEADAGHTASGQSGNICDADDALSVISSVHIDLSQASASEPSLGSLGSDDEGDTLRPIHAILPPERQGSHP